MTAELSALRSLHGESTALWAGAHGVRVERGRWIALSGAPSVDYNVALCHAGGIDAASRTRQEIVAAGAPALIMVAGAALGEVQVLMDEHWVCIGSVPFMAKRLNQEAARPRDETVRALGEDEIALARALTAEVFELDRELVQVALPPDLLRHEGRTLWGAFDAAGSLVSCLVSVAVAQAVVIWSMATASRVRRAGHGGRLLDRALAHAAENDAQLALLHSSAQGEAFYRSAGFCELERWQLWSRPRWVLGRA